MDLNGFIGFRNFHFESKLYGGITRIDGSVDGNVDLDDDADDDGLGVDGDVGDVVVMVVDDVFIFSESENERFMSEISSVVDCKFKESEK